MKLIVDRDDIVSAMEVVRSTVPARNTIPVLSHVLFVAGNGRLSLTTSSLDMQSDVVIAADVDAGGAICVPAEILHSAVRGFAKGAQVAMALGSDGRIAVASGRSKLNIKSLAPDDFPAAPKDDFVTTFDISAADLRRGINAVSYATYDGGVDRPVLQGMRLYVVGAQMRCVATDGHRLSEFCMPAPDGSASMPDIIIGNVALKTFANLLKDAEQATISVAPHAIMIRVGNASVRSQLIGGEYPDYERVIPKANGVTASVYADVLGDATDRASAVFNGTAKALAVRLSGGIDGIALHAMSPDGNEATEEADAEVHDKAFAVALNPRYVRDMTKAWPYPGQPIDVHYTSAQTPVLFKSADHPNVRVVIMPTRDVKANT